MRLVESVKGLQAHDPDFNLENLLSELALGGVAGSPTDGNSIKVATLHSAKGLQWPNVFFVGLEEGSLPDHRSKSAASEHEERRLCFVGVCRAEDNLTLTSVRNWGRFSRLPSRFLEEMELS